MEQDARRPRDFHDGVASRRRQRRVIQSEFSHTEHTRDRGSDLMRDILRPIRLHARSFLGRSLRGEQAAALIVSLLQLMLRLFHVGYINADENCTANTSRPVVQRLNERSYLPTTIVNTVEKMQHTPPKRRTEVRNHEFWSV
jgi:hypothetical protein